MAARRRDAPPALPVELVEEILLRLPPDEPAWLLRASLVCKIWGRAVSRRSFRRRLHELHGAPPVLGFLRNLENESRELVSRFIPATASSFSLAAPDRGSIWALDCRHGRALFLYELNSPPKLLVWEPITGGEWLVPVPAMFERFPGAAVVCAADGCDHRDCHGHGGPFRLVFVFNLRVNADSVESDTFACVYSSETGTWGEPSTSVHSKLDMHFLEHSSLLVGRSVLYFMSDDGFILEYDLARHGLTVIDTLHFGSNLDPERLNLVLVEDGGLGVSQELYPHLKLWTRQASEGPHAPWVLSRVINLGSLLQIGAVVNQDTRVRVVGFAEGANVIFVDTHVGIFTVELQSEKVRKVCDDNNGFCSLIPVVGFYTPVKKEASSTPSNASATISRTALARACLRQDEVVTKCQRKEKKKEKKAVQNQ